MDASMLPTVERQLLEVFFVQKNLFERKHEKH